VCLAIVISTHEFQDDLDAIASIPAVQSILEVVCRTTAWLRGRRPVTDERWICCAVKDDIAFGLKPGGELSWNTSARDPRQPKWW